MIRISKRATRPGQAFGVDDGTDHGLVSSDHVGSGCLRWSKQGSVGGRQSHRGEEYLLPKTRDETLLDAHFDAATAEGEGEAG